MALVVEIGITNSRGGVSPIELLEIRRLEPLGEGDDHDDEVHPYVVNTHIPTEWGWHGPVDTASLAHRYGDGARTLVSNALAALGHPENKEVR